MLNIELKPGVFPENYQEVFYWRLTSNFSRVVILNIISVLSFVVFGWLFLEFARIFAKLSLSVSFDLFGMAILFLSIVFTLILHEGIHAIFMKMFGSKPIFGFIFPIAIYTTSPGFAYKRNSYLIITLAPLLVINLLYIGLTLLFSGSPFIFILLICATVNASGAAGDLWISKIVLGYPKSAFIMDEKDGVRVFLAKS